MSDHIVIERHGAVQTIRMNRPDKKNALTRAMYAAMTGALVEGDANPDIRAHVFLGVPGAFSSGNDLQDFMAESRLLRVWMGLPSASARRSISIAT
jgi:enoyl-CoA hydratase/carnithine racemase